MPSLRRVMFRLVEGFSDLAKTWWYGERTELIVVDWLERRVVWRGENWYPAWVRDAEGRWVVLMRFVPGKYEHYLEEGLDTTRMALLDLKELQMYRLPALKGCEQAFDALVLRRVEERREKRV